MRKSVKQQLALRVLSTAALMAMVSSIATAAFADTYDLNKGSVDILAEDGNQYITQWEDKDNNLCVKDDKGEDIRNRLDDDITLTTKDETTGETKTTSNTVTIDAKEDNTANVTLKDVHIEVDTADTKSGAIEIKGDGDTNLELNGNNTVLVTNQWFKDEHAAIEKADTYGKGTLTIKDDVNDDDSKKTGTDEDTTGKLLAGGCHGAAAIGGGGGEFADTSNITITGGEITASGGSYGAGIGGGSYGAGTNIRIEGNADVTAFGSAGAAIGAGYQSTRDSDITITDHATVDAASYNGCGIGQGLNAWGNATITISGNASVNAEAFGSAAAIGNHYSSATVNIEDHADVTAVGLGVAIGTGYGSDSNGGTSTVINITGGTVNAVTRDDFKPAIGTVKGNLDLTINSSTGKTTVNAYTTSSDPLSLSIGTGHYDYSSWKHSTSPSEGAEYNEDGSSNLGEDNTAIINSYRNTTLGTDTYKAPKTLDDYAFHPTYEYQGTLYNAKHTLSDKDKGDLYKVVHNRKYMDETIDTSDLKDEDLHDWKLVGKVVEPTTEKDGYADYICSIDKCGQTKHVVLPKLTPEPSEPDTPSTPETPDTPDTPNKPDTPKQPDGTTPAPVTPDAPAQDGTAPADTPAADTTADAAATPAAAQNVVQNAKPEAAAPAAAAVLPQTGANWLAVVGSALSGLFLLAAGFVLDRKGRRMN